jgi:hypothetical protein
MHVYIVAEGNQRIAMLWTSGHAGRHGQFATEKYTQSQTWPERKPSVFRLQTLAKCMLLQSDAMRPAVGSCLRHQEYLNDTGREMVQMFFWRSLPNLPVSLKNPVISAEL